EEAARLRADESLCYVRGDRKGEMKPEGEKKLERLEKVAEAARLIEAYEKLKDERDVYDFADVLNIAVTGLDADADLKASVQEQYQYILADEHQDANALQHALLDTLAYDEHPNIFVVGDEKQAIYRFQGADSSHFKTFTEHFPRTELIQLTDSYRSLQSLLDTAHGVIAKVPASTGEHPKLSAVREGTATVSLLAAADPLAERDQVAQLIEEAIASGTAPEEIAVISSRNATANLFAEHLEARGIPTLRAGDVLLSARPLMRSILALMRTIADPLDIAALRETLLAPWWELPLALRSEMLLKNRDRELWGSLTLAEPEIAECLQKLQKAALSEGALPLLSRAIADTGARGYFLSHAEHLEDLGLLRKVFMHVEEIVAREPNRSFREVVSAFTKAHEHGLESVKSSVTLREGMVTVITAHKAKGMEFERVFVVGMNARQWEKGGMPAKIPSPIDQKRSAEDATKLFYVAITRAKNELVLSYSIESGEGRDLPPSLLIPEGLPTVTSAVNPLPLLHATIEPTKAVNDLVYTYLTEEGLSPSALNEYIESPPVFFARRVLRLHEPESPATTIGSAVHAGIAEYLATKDTDKAYATLAGTLGRSLLPRNAAYDRVVEDATARLAAYLAHPETAEAVAIEKAFSITKEVCGKDILLYGKIDAVFKGDRGEEIVDFKTSSKIDEKDASYPRQLAFYDYLLRGNGHTPATASIVQVATDGVTAYPVALTDETRAELADTLEAVISELLTGEWRKGERKRDDSDAYDDILKLFTVL
ncbi:MAG: helicase / ATP-dependent helicase PcrA, partial [Parcubacteria group bacterium]|nr:helicase / ATP-dependent helicase PcrA [Parcubacteria group bacterium]